MKTILFFVVIAAVLLYLNVFWENGRETVKFHLFHKKTDMNLGALMLAVFLDGAIIAILLLWLLGHLK